MSLATCLARLRDEGIIDPERAARFEREYARLHAAHGKALGATAAIDVASRDTLDALEWQLLNQKRQAALDVANKLGLLEQLTAHIEQGGKPGQFAIQLLEHHEAVGGFASVENTRGALWNLSWSRIPGFLDRYRRDLLGRIPHGDEMVEIVRALKGEGTSNVFAKQMAEAIGETFEWLRVQYNALGGNIARLEGWGLPQSHDALAVAQAGFEAWKAFIRPLLDPARMIDNTTGKAFASGEALDEALEAAWRNISSEGLDGRVPGSFAGDGKIANRRSDHRFLVFRDADAWLAYNERFGSGDAFNSIIGHIDGMTRDLAAMRVLGPNPEATVRWMRDLLNQQALPGKAGGKGAALDGKARKGAGEMERMWRYYSGELTAIAPENRSTARFFQGVRNWNIMAKLGRAALSAIPTDPVFRAYTAAFNGLPVVRTLFDGLRTMNPADPAHREAAAHAGLVFHEMAVRAERLHREGQGINLVELTRRGADGLLRTTLLTPHTVGAKQALGLGFMKDWAEHAGTAFEQLGKGQRLALERYGIGAAEWDRLRSVAVDDHDGVKLLRPGDLARRGGEGDLDAAIKFFALIDSETRFGTPGEQLRAQTMLALGGRGSAFERGTVMGELAHSATQFKTYSVIATTTHIMRMLYGRGALSRAQYAATLPIFLTIMGTVAFALRELAYGRDLPDPEDPQTWARGFATAGGAGFLGDIGASAIAGQRGTTGAVASFITGPTIGGVIDPAINLTLGNLGEAARGEDTRLSSELFRQARMQIPGNNAWYAKLAADRMVLDRLQEIADPNHARSWRRQRSYARQQGTDFWWAPGEPLPGRAPEFSNATEEGPAR